MVQDDYIEMQLKCPLCGNGDKFFVKEIATKARANGIRPNKDEMALALALICTMCDKITFYLNNSLSSVMKRILDKEKPKQRTTKRIA